MKNYILFGILFCVSCKSFKNSYILIGFENNSASDSTIIIETLLNNETVSSETIIRNDKTSAINSWRKVKLSGRDYDTLKFVAKNGDYNSSSNTLILTPEDTRGKWVHVNFVKILFRKGDAYNDKVLHKDTVVQQNFYCELVEKLKK